MMKKLLLTSYILFSLFACKKSEPSESALNKLSQVLIGEYDNFQQCWQEHTQTDIHRVDIETPHKHIHIVLRTAEDTQHLNFKMYEGRDSSKIIREAQWELRENGRESQILSTHAKGQDTFALQKLDKAYILDLENEKWKFQGDSLIIKNLNQSTGWETDHLLLPCRFFSGWITYSLPEYPDSSFRLGDLRIHDQGGIIPLVLEDGSPTDYSVELTQLVYGRKISIMKLAVYKENFEGIHYNSQSISYTWTNPTAKRIGINLRKVSSGWTLIEPGYVNSNNLNRN
ncbi:MAG: hypothetical protein AAF696_06520 [Bacteroidota bacterium]